MTSSAIAVTPTAPRLDVSSTGDVHKSERRRLETPAWVWCAQRSDVARSASSGGTGNPTSKTPPSAGGRSPSTLDGPPGGSAPAAGGLSNNTALNAPRPPGTTTRDD